MFVCFVRHRADFKNKWKSIECDAYWAIDFSIHFSRIAVHNFQIAAVGSRLTHTIKQIFIGIGYGQGELHDYQYT